MYSRIIVGHDLRDGGHDALALGRLIAESTGANLIVAGVFPFGTLPHGFELQWREREAEVAAELERVAEAAGAEPEAFPSSSPARGLHDLAEERNADLVVVGSSRRGKVGQILAGNVGLGLLHGSPCEVGIAPHGYGERHDRRLESIVVGIDGSDEGRLALTAAVELARAAGARLRLVGVGEPPPTVYGKGAGPGQGLHELESAIEDLVGTRLEEARSSIPDDLNVETALVCGDPAVELSDAARGDGDLMMVGSRSYGPLRRVLLGSVSSTLVRSATCPVLVHPRGHATP